MSQGIERVFTLDGTDFAVNPDALDIDRETLETISRTMDGGSRIDRTLVNTGDALLQQRFTFSMPFGLLTQTEIDTLEGLEAMGGHHTLCIWKPMTAKYRAAAGQTRFVIPRYRRNAPHALGITMSASTYSHLVPQTPVVKVNATSLTVGTANGPTVTTPAAGNATIGRDAHTSGELRGYCEFRVGTTLVAGDIITFTWFPLFTVSITSRRVQYPSGIAEAHEFVFTEK